MTKMLERWLTALLACGLCCFGVRAQSAQPTNNILKRVLAELQPQGAPVAFIVTPAPNAETLIPLEVCDELGIPVGSKWKNTFTFGFGPTPKYPRINARASTSKK